MDWDDERNYQLNDSPYQGVVLKQGLFDLGFQSTRPRRWSF
jgi:hypothetical protein